MPLDHTGPGRAVGFHPADRAVEAEQIRLLLKNPVDVPANLINTVLVAVVVWPLYPAWVMVVWLEFVCVVNLTRALLRQRFLTATDHARTSPIWVRLFTLNAFLGGCLWGLCASVILRTPDPIYEDFIVFVLGGMMAGAVVCLAINMPAMLAFILPTVLPAIVILALRGGLVHLEMATMLALFTLVLVWTGRNFNHSLTENIRLRFGQERLVASLRSSEAAMAETQTLTHLGAWEIDLESNSNVWSAETYRIFGVNPLVFKPSLEAFLARIHPDDRKAVTDDMAALLANGSTRGIDHRIVMDDHSIKYVHELARAIYGAGGRIMKLAGSIQDITERRQREATTQTLSAIVDASVDAIYAQALDGTIISWNKGAEHLFGYRTDEAIGQSIRIIIPQDRREQIDRHLAALARGQTVAPFDSERLHKDGTRVPVSIAVSATRDAAHAMIGASFVTRDITERQVAAAALAYRERLLHAATAGTGTLVKAQSLDLGMPETLRIVGEAMRVDRVLVFEGSPAHPAGLRLRHHWEAAGIKAPIESIPLGTDEAALAAEAAWADRLIHNKPVIVHLDTSEGPIREMLQRFDNKSMLLVPIFNGDVFWGTLSADACTIRRDWTAIEIEMLRTFADIAGALIQRMAAGHALEASETRFRTVTQSAQDAIITVDGAARISLWNHAAERILGYTAEEAAGKQVHELLAPSELRATAERNMKKFLATGTRDLVGKTTELVARRKDGTEITIELALTAARLGGTWGAIAILRDITERKAADRRLQFANLLLKTEMETSPDGILVVSPTRQIILFNQRFSDIWRIPAVALRNATFDTVLLLARPLMIDPAQFTARANRLFDHRDRNSHDEYALSDGRTIDRDIMTLASDTGEYLGRVWYFRDVTERRSVEDRLAFANLLFRTQMEASPDGILIVNEKKVIVAFNQRFAAIWKIPSADVAMGDAAPQLATAASQIRDERGYLDRVQYLYDHPGEDSQDEYETTDGRFIDRYTVTLYGPSRTYLGRAWFFRDITQRRESEALALRMARYDVLTGLANRAVFVDALKHAIAIAKRGERTFAVLYLDLDHFKDVNDTLGHPVGDELLKAVADRLRSNTRGTDTVARFGGDEFAIVGADIADPAGAAILADKLRDAFAIPFSVVGNDIHTGVSIGIAFYGSEGADAETLLSHADVALYRAKLDGRGGYRFFTDAMDRDVKSRVALGAELRAAADHGQLFLVYQPQVAIDTGRITGMEALVRWRHPHRGVLLPGVFIPIAEQIGIIAKLGHWVLWEACRQGKAWLDAGVAPVRISVNVSALQFRTPAALEADIAATLAQTGFPPHLLELELTESVLMVASREHSDLLQRLRKTGVTLAIDDFGTGYSSLDYLRKFPSNRIKIAQNFVSNLETTPGDAAIIRATISLARELNIEVIAEGVETAVQRDLLREWGCGEVQGYLFAKPMTAEDADAALRDGTILPAKAAAANAANAGA